MKFALLANKITPDGERAIHEQPHRSGLWNWLYVFNGEVVQHDNWEIDWQKYDVIQVNCAPVEMPNIPYIYNKIKNSSTMLVLNNDYVVDAWESWDHMPYLYDNTQLLGDMVFATEPYAQGMMRPGTYLIPHPTDTKVLKRVGSDRYRESESIGSPFHDWEGRTLNHWTYYRRIREAGIKLVPRIYNMDVKRMKQARWHRALFGAEGTETINTVDYPDYLEMVMMDKLFVEPTTFHTYGRNTVDMACLRIPTICSDRVYSGQILWKQTLVNPYDIPKMVALTKRILNDEAFTQQILDEAYENVEHFNYKNSKERYMAALEESRKRVGK